MKIQAMIVMTVLGLAACSRAPADGTPAGQAAAASPPAAKQQPSTDDPHAAFPNESVDAVAQMLATGDCVPVDANGAETRAQYGVLPSAVLLSSYQSYPVTELPADKDTKLVFYCGSQKCTAAPKAAQLAAEAGYKNVRVMRDGIKGWVAAGKQVSHPST